MASRFTKYGGALGADAELRQMVAERIAAQMEQRKQQVENYKLQQDDLRIGQGDRRMDIDQEQFGQTHALDTTKHGENVRQFDAQAPDREARTGYLRTQTRHLEEAPMRDTASRVHDETMAKLGHGFRLGEIEAQGNQQARVAGIRTGPAPGAGAGQGYSADKADDVMSAIDDLLGKHGPDGARVGGRITGWTAGLVGSGLSNIGGTDAADVSADLASVAANVAFGALQEMREASKTGGALGQVSERELDLLSGVEGSIRQNQSPSNLRKNLEKIYESRQRFLAAKRGLAQMQPAHGDNPAGGAAMEFDWIDGKLVPRGR